MLLSEDPHIRLDQNGGPVVVLARHRGKYTRPVAAYQLDMRLEDIRELPKTARLVTFTWVARHPTEPLWLIHDGTARGKIYSRVSDNQCEKWEENWKLRREAMPPARDQRFELPRRPYQLPDRWWEYVVAIGPDNRTIKAALHPRPGEPTADDIDEASSLIAPLSTRLEWIFR